MGTLQPTSLLAGISAYRVERPLTPVDLHLDGNEGPAPSRDLLADLGALEPELLRRYPDARPLEEQLASRLGIEPERVLVTAGADDAIDRVCRAVLAPGRSALVPEPTFSMIDRFVHLAGGRLIAVDWSGPRYPTDAVLARVESQTALIVVVSPNNPTGGVATAEDVRRLCLEAPQALVLLDHAYVELASEDLTALAASLSNLVVLRTLSKAWGLAGLRVGAAVASTEVLGWLRAAGHPYSVSGPSIFLAQRWLELGEPVVEAYSERVREERLILEGLLERLGGRVSPSQGNFVFARVDDPSWIRDGLAGMGIGVRIFPGDPRLRDALRITCPGSGEGLRRLAHALETTLLPEAILFDMDGVLADVSRSYEQAIIQTVAHHGREVTPADVAAEVAAGDANNDWVVSRRLLARRGVTVPLQEVTETFEGLYQGGGGKPGLWERETPLVERGVLEALAARFRLGVVTGRPAGDAHRFLERFDLDGLFGAVVCMGDAPPKPDPAPVRLAMDRLGVTRAWMLGDTPDDVRAARSAGALPLGVAFSSGEDLQGSSRARPEGRLDHCRDDTLDGVPGDATLLGAGAARVLHSPEQLLEILHEPT